MAHLVLIVVYFAAAISELFGICLTVQLFLRNDNDGTAVVITHRRWAARRGPILIAVGVVLGLIGNFSAMHMSPMPSAPLPPSSATDGCDNNDGLFGLCGAGQNN
jgi:hypothetical protein